MSLGVLGVPFGWWVRLLGRPAPVPVSPYWGVGLVVMDPSNPGLVGFCQGRNSQSPGLNVTLQRKGSSDSPIFVQYVCRARHLLKKASVLANFFRKYYFLLVLFWAGVGFVDLDWGSRLDLSQEAVGGLVVSLFSSQHHTPSPDQFPMGISYELPAWLCSSVNQKRPPIVCEISVGCGFMYFNPFPETRDSSLEGCGTWGRQSHQRKSGLETDLSLLIELHFPSALCFPVQWHHEQ